MLQKVQNYVKFLTEATCICMTHNISLESKKKKKKKNWQVWIWLYHSFTLSFKVFPVYMHLKMTVMIKYVIIPQGFEKERHIALHNSVYACWCVDMVVGLPHLVQLITREDFSLEASSLDGR